MYSGVAYTAAVNSRTSLKLRSAWMPPAVAQAPIVTRKRDCLRTSLDPLRVVGGRDRALDEGQVVGPLHDLARGLEEVGDLDLARHRQELVLAVEERELAAVAGGELEDGERRLGRPRHTSRMPKKRWIRS